MTVQPEPGGYTSGNARYCLRMLPFLTGAVTIVIVRAKSASEDARQYKQQARWDAQHQFQPDPTQPPFTGTPVSDIHGKVTYRQGAG